MKKKPTPIYKKPWFPILMAVVIIPTGTMLWAYITSVFAAPAEIKSVKEAVIRQTETQEYLKQMVDRNEKKDAEQDAEIEKSKEISALQIDSLKEILKSFQRPR